MTGESKRVYMLKRTKELGLACVKLSDMLGRGLPSSEAVNCMDFIDKKGLRVPYLP